MNLKIKLLIILLASGIFSGLYAQNSNLIFFTEQGERFTVILNGICYNNSPETHVRITDLPAPGYKLKVIFEDTDLGQIDKNLIFNQGMETTFVIKPGKKNDYVVRWMNEVPLARVQAPQPPRQASNNHHAPVNHPVTQSTTTISESYTMPAQNNVSMGVHIDDPESGINFNMNINGGVNNGTQVTTTHTTTTYSGTGLEENYSGMHPHTVQQTYVLPGYSGPAGCAYPMHPADFQQAKHSIAGKSFDDTRLILAKQIIASNCPACSSEQKNLCCFFLLRTPDWNWQSMHMVTLTILATTTSSTMLLISNQVLKS
ncbi:hypothetical protein MASR1M74_12930 [Lentimicrobium sp.]